MSSCASVEHLLYLHRAGELTDSAREMVSDHCRSCARCAAILHELQILGRALEAERNEAPVKAMVDDDRTAILAKVRRGNALPAQQSAFRDVLFGWLRPAVALVVVAPLLVLLFQMSRDALRQSMLEDRLAARNTSVFRPSLKERLSTARETFFGTSGADSASFIHALPNRAVLSDPRALLQLWPFLESRSNRGLLEELSAKYPDLATITLADGLDDAERRILDTEGRKFAKELDRLIEEGVRK